MTEEATPAEVNLGDILRMSLPLRTDLLGGNSLTHRHVGWAAWLSSWADLETQLKTNDLVLVPPALQERLTAERAQRILPWLNDLPAAGLVFFQDLSGQLKAALQKSTLPVLIVPEGTSLREVHQSISLLLLDRQAATSERAMQLYRRLSTMSREGRGLKAMTEVMSHLTGNIILVQDKRMEIQAISWPNNTGVDREALLGILQQHEQLPPVLLNRKAAARAKQSYWQQLLPIEGMGRLISPIVSGDRARGYLSVVGPAGELDLLDSLTVEHGAAACALEMAKAKAVSEARKALRGDFLEGMLAGTLPPSEIARLDSRLDHDTTKPHAVMTIAWSGNNPPSLRRLETSLHWILNNHPRPTLAHTYGNQYIVVFQALKEDDDMDSAQKLGRRLLEQVKAEFPEAVLLVGISGPAPTLTDWPAVYEEALQAMQLAQRLQLTNQIIDFNSLGIFQLLYELESLPDVRRFATGIMAPLIDYDQRNRGSLVKTIDAYFTHHGNVSQTAESLFVHRNTLLYRLDRIQELTDLQLSQSNMRLALHLALRLWQLQADNQHSWI